ncbi:MAG: methionyl-tRNA formyltransferase [Butyricicoccus sp.]|nr:methionyl-tRNA formyltransferase [Butyricicoccus sp.]
MRIVFMGTPDFAAASLKKLIEEKYELAGVFTQPDKPRGRGMSLQSPPVKLLAREHGIPVYQPEKLRDGTALEILKNLDPDIIAVVAYGRILPDDILALPRLGCVNVHGSLLPKYRGSAPIQWAVLNGDERTGVTTAYVTSELDSGDIIYTDETDISEFETSGELFDRLMDMGARLLDKTLRAIERGEAPRTPQDHSQATFTKQLDKSMCPIDWTRPAREIVKHIYGLQPWPVATAEIGGTVCRIYAARCTQNTTEKPAGSIVSAGKHGIEFACGGGQTLLLTELQAPGKKRMAASDYLRGHPVKL